MAGGDAATWTAAADMWQFGSVLELWGDQGSALGELGRQLSAALLKENPEDRPRAKQARFF